jgi:ABC-type transport system involved in multi-copper enzyme maturation permease subunit
MQIKITNAWFNGKPCKTGGSKVKGMNEITAIAGGTWNRILRMRTVYILIVCVLALIGSAYRYDVLSLGQHEALMVDVSLLLNTIAAILISISITFEIAKEFRGGVATTLLSKSLGRTQYLIGKLIGISIAGIVITGLIAIGFCLIFSSSFDQIAQSMIVGHLLIMVSIIPMSALAILFAVLLPESVAAIVTVIAIWFAHSTVALTNVPVIYGGIIPDLNLFNLKASYSYAGGISWLYLVLVLVWGIVYSIFATSLAGIVFSKKDLK